MEATPERKPPNRGIEVKLLGHSPDPIRSLYLAYRTAYSALTPLQINDRIEDERITRETMLEFIEKRLETGHASPLEQVWFEFGIAGVTRAFSHQFVRHHMGISFEQQSQRYVTFKGGEFPYTVPESVKRAGLEHEYAEEFDRVAGLYDRLVQAGVPAEDARFVIPNAANTNFKITVNFLEFLHIADLRLCTRAQWEFRKVVALMRRGHAPLPGARALPAAQVRRAPPGLLRRALRRLAGLPHRPQAPAQVRPLRDLRRLPPRRAAVGRPRHGRQQTARGRRLQDDRGRRELRRALTSNLLPSRIRSWTSLISGIYRLIQSNGSR